VRSFFLRPATELNIQKQLLIRNDPNKQLFQTTNKQGEREWYWGCACAIVFLKLRKSTPKTRVRVKVVSNEERTGMCFSE
jgi:hypothetical protein